MRGAALGMRGWPRVGFWVALALLAILGVFVFPLQFPPATPTYSASYVFGFSNRIAGLAVIVLSLGTAAFCSRWDVASSGCEVGRGRGDAMPLAWLLVACLATLLYVGVVGGLAAGTESFESDGAYFLTQLAQGTHFHLRLYRDLEFGYGPLLFAWPAAFGALLGRLHVGFESAYVVSLAVLQVVGLGISFYVVQWLPLPRFVKGGILLALTVGTMRPSLGLNYTLFRFLTPLAALIFVSRFAGKVRQAVVLSVSQMLMLCISPEIGIAFLAGTLFYTIYSAYERDWRWLFLPVLPMLSFLAFCARVDRGYFYTMRQFTGGMLHRVISPTPEILLLLLSAIALAPIAVAGAVRRNGPEAGTLIALYGASLALIPAALGLCDPLHTFFNGLGLYLLSFLALGEPKGYWSKLGLVAFVLIASPTQPQTITAALVTRHMQQARAAAEDRQVAEWEREAGGARIFAPAGLPFPMWQKLLSDDRLQPDYFSGLDNAFDPAGEQIKRKEMQSARFVLAPQGSMSAPTPDERRRMRLLRFGYRYRVRKAAYLPLEHLRADLLARGTPADSSAAWNGLVLYRMP